MIAKIALLSVEEDWNGGDRAEADSLEPLCIRAKEGRGHGDFLSRLVPESRSKPLVWAKNMSRCLCPATCEEMMP